MKFVFARYCEFVFSEECLWKEVIMEECDEPVQLWGRRLISCLRLKQTEQPSLSCLFAEAQSSHTAAHLSHSLPALSKPSKLVAGRSND